MKNKSSIFTIILSIFLLASCSNKETRTIDNIKYKLVRPAITNANGIVDAELWEKNGVTNYYYTPSLSGRSMIPVMR